MNLQPCVHIAVYVCTINLLINDSAIFRRENCFQIDYFNNKVIVDLVEAQHTGVIAMLDEACLNVGKVTDQVATILCTAHVLDHYKITTKPLPLS